MTSLSLSRLSAAGLMALACTGAFAAGVVNVTFVGPDQFTDFGAPRQIRSNTQTLTRHFVAAGKLQLRDGETLDVDVLDIDLAGSMRPWNMTSGGDPIRVVRDMETTRMHVRYKLTGPGDVARSGDEWLNSSSMAMDPLVWRSSAEEFRPERRMLDGWMKKLDAAAAP